MSEAQENLQKMLAEQERGSSHPVYRDATSQVTDLQQMVNMLQAERDTLDRSCNLAGDAAGGSYTLHRVRKRQPRTSENDQQKGKNHFHQNHFHQKKKVSSENHFHQKTTFIRKPLSSKNHSHQKDHSHQKNH